MKGTLAQLAEPLSALCVPLKHDPCLDWLLVGALSAPHFLYAYIWFFPNSWHRAFGKRAVDVFAAAGVLGKVLQFSVLLAWLWAVMPSGLCIDVTKVELWQWLAFLILGAFGQSLNVGIYNAIGKAGVYYGFKLGKKIPWVEGFPFNVVNHPQYVGSAMSVWAAAILLMGQAPQSLLYVTAYWTGLYVITGFQEQYL